MRKDDRYDSLIFYYAELHGFSGHDWLRFKAQIKVESNFEPDTKSPAGAVGLSQFMPATWAEWQDGQPGIQVTPYTLGLIDPRDPEDAIQAQVAYMKWLRSRMHNNWELSFAAYNWGIGRLQRIHHDPLWKSKLPLETENYLFRINKAYDEYRRSNHFEG